MNTINPTQNQLASSLAVKPITRFSGRDYRDTDSMFPSLTPPPSSPGSRSRKGGSSSAGSFPSRPAPSSLGKQGGRTQIDWGDDDFDNKPSRKFNLPKPNLENFSLGDLIEGVRDHGKRIVGGIVAAALGVAGVNYYMDRPATIDSNWNEEVKAAHAPVQALLAQQTQQNISPTLIQQMLTNDLTALKTKAQQQYDMYAIQLKPADQRTTEESTRLSSYENAKFTPIDQGTYESTLQDLASKESNVAANVDAVSKQLAEDIQRRYSYSLEHANMSPIDATALTWAIVIDPATRARFGGLQAMVGPETDQKIFLPLMDKYSIALVENDGDQNLALATVYAGRQMVKDSGGVPELQVVTDFIKRYTDSKNLLSTAINVQAAQQLADDKPALSDMAFRLVAMMGTQQVQNSSYFVENENWTQDMMERLAGYYGDPGETPTLSPALLDPVLLIPAMASNTDAPYDLDGLLSDFATLSENAPGKASVGDYLSATEMDNQFLSPEQIAKSEDPDAIRNYYAAKKYKDRVAKKVAEATSALTLPANPLEQVIGE